MKFQLQPTLPNTSSQRKVISILLLALLAISAAMRLYRLNSGLWLDEIFTVMEYARLPFRAIVTTFESENQHFLFTLLAHTSFLLFGESAWALRLPAVLFGVASIWALFLLGRQVSNDVEGLLAAALMAFSYHHVWFSQNGRGYSGLLFWAIFSSYWLVRGMEEGQARHWLLYAASAALGMYTHMTMMFVIAGQLSVYVLQFAWNRWKQEPFPLKGLFQGFGIGGLSTLLLFAPVISQIRNTVGGTEASVVTEWKNPIWTVLEILRGLEVSFASGVVVIAALVLFSAGLLSYLRTRPIVVGLLVFPPVIGAAVTLAIGHHLWPRFFFFAMGFGALIVIRGVIVTGQFLARLVRMPEARAVWAGPALCLGLALVSALSVPFAYGPKQDFEGAMQYVKANAQPNDAIVTVSLAADIYEKFYNAGWTNVTSVEALNQVRARSEKTWLIYTFPPVLESVYPDIMASIRKDFQVVKEFRGTVGEGSIFVCLANPLSAHSTTP